MQPTSTFLAVCRFAPAAIVAATTFTSGVRAAEPGADISVSTDADENRPKRRPGGFQLGATFLKEHGFGVAARVRTGYVGLEAAYGLFPVLLMVESPTTSSIEADVSMVHADLGPVFYWTKPTRSNQNGIRLAGIYDEIMGAGFMTGWVGEWYSPNTAWSIGLGLQVYPDAESRIQEHFDLGGTPSSFSGAVQPYFGLSYLWNTAH